MAGSLDVTDRQFQNFICAFRVVNLVGENLETYTRTGLKSVHDNIIQNLGHLPACTKQCSQQIHNLKGWCVTCTAWKMELEKYHRHPIKQNQWKQFKSWTWPKKPEEIAELFVPPNWTPINLQDLSSIFSIWKDCTEFRQTLQGNSDVLKKHRNDLAHSKTFTISDPLKEKIYNDVKRLLSEPDIKPTLVNPQVLYDILDNPEENSLFQNANIQELISNVSNQNKNMQKRLDSIEEELKAGKKAHCNISFQTISYMVVALVVAVWGSWLLAQGAFKRTEKVLQLKSGCLEERHVQDLFPMKHFSMVEYALKHKDFIGRRWLFRDLEERLISKNNKSSSHGILLLAEMGYGKSAIMSHTICANESDVGYGLRKHLIAYHICRFDVAMSKSGGLFIQRILAMISNELIGIESFLEQDRTCIDYYMTGQESCDRDFFGCLDHCLLFPLKSLNLENKTFIILIDGLDECYDDMTKQNVIMRLLKFKIKNFPQWIKFLISARNLQEFSILEKDFEAVELSSYQSDNIEDAKHFLSTRSKNDFLLQSGFSNFQFLTIALENEMLTNINYTSGKSPNHLNRIYEYNFERIFKDDYKIASQILSILLASSSPLTEDTLIEIMTAQGIDLKDAVTELRRIKHFLVVFNKCLHFSHNSLSWWLRHEDTKYRISVEDGHTLIANHTVTLIRGKAENSRIDPVELVIHIARSSQFSLLEKEYMSLKGYFLKIVDNKEEPFIHRLSSITDDYTAIQLFLAHFGNVDVHNKAGNTALYVSASVGHVEAVKSLIDNGADINFRREGVPRAIGLNNAVEMGTDFKQWGYSIFDISSQNGHLNVVKFLLKFDKFLYNVTNGLNLLPIHLACKFGHLNIVQIISSEFKWMPDVQCLYYGSNLGYTELTQFLLDYGIKEECQRCEEKMYWIPEHSTRIQGSSDRPGESRNYVVYDDWKFINCETALHTAVTKNRTDIVRLLISKDKSTSHCFDRGGNTPLMVAVRMGLELITKALIDRYGFNSAEVCKPFPLITETKQLSEDELAKMKNNYCIEGQSISHIAVRFNRELFYKYNAKFDMSKRDIFGCYIIHDAACNCNVHQIENLHKIFGKFIFDLTCNNGSLPIHSAAQCGCFDNVNVILLNGWSSTNATDSLNRTLAMYAVKKYLETDSAFESKSFSKESDKISSLAIKSKHDLIKTDFYNRNIFHYAIENGHFTVVSRLYHVYEITSIRLLKAKDVLGKTPLRHSIKLIRTARNFVLNTTDILDKQCYTKAKRHFLTPYDYTMFFLWHKSPKNFCANDASEAMTIMTRFIKNMRFNLFFAYYKCCKPNIDDYDLGRLLNLTFKYDSSGISSFLLFIRAGSVKFSLQMCQGKYTFSMIRFIVLNFNRLFNVLGERNTLLNIFSVDLANLLGECKDLEQFTIADRAIQGGNVGLVKHLIENGFRLSQSIFDTLIMSLMPPFIRGMAKYSVNSHMKYSDLVIILYTQKYIVYNTTDVYDESYDQITSYLIETFHKKIHFRFMCSSKASNLSIVHLLAIQNRLLSLKTVAKLYGKHILTCSNRDNLTPFYLATFFGANEVILYLKSVTKLTKPVEYTQENLLFRVLSKFILRKTNIEGCFSQNNAFRLRNIPKGLRLVKCIRKAIRLLKVSDEQFKGCLYFVKVSYIFLSNFKAMAERKIPVYIPVDKQQKSKSIEIDEDNQQYVGQGNVIFVRKNISVWNVLGSDVPYQFCNLDKNRHESQQRFINYSCKVARKTHIEIVKALLKLVKDASVKPMSQYTTQAIKVIEHSLTMHTTIDRTEYCRMICINNEKANIEKVLRDRLHCAFKEIQNVLLSVLVKPYPVPYMREITDKLIITNFLSDNSWLNHYFRYSYFNVIQKLSAYKLMFEHNEESILEALLISNFADTSRGYQLSCLFEKYQREKNINVQTHDEL